MPNRLQPLVLDSFVGGLNLRRSQFQLGDNESPDLLNVDVDPRGGFFTRRGWQRWNRDDVVDVSGGALWRPRNAAVHNLADGRQVIYVVSEGKIYAAPDDGIFTELSGIVADAAPHDADFASWGDDVYIACGSERPSYRRSGVDAPVVLAPDLWSEYDSPTYGMMPHAEFVAGHAGYLFVAGTREGAEPGDVLYHSRLRWSHFNQPDAWRADDHLDIEIGGGRITGLMSFQDHLIIFKTDSLWALFGYDEDSWQLVKVSRSVGCPSITAATRSESAVFFYSASDKGGIYGFSGETPTLVSDAIRPALEDIISYENVWVSWANRRLWVAVPWVRQAGATIEPTSLFVFDPDIGTGAWTLYRSAYGVPAPVIDGSDVNSRFPLGALWSNQAAAMVVLDRLEQAYDVLDAPASLGVTPGEAYLVTSSNQEIGVEGVAVTGIAFDSYYYTRWLHAGWPDRKKSWRRPTFICRQVDAPVELLVESYRDYDETNVHRTRTLRVPAEGTAYWREGGYTDGTDGGFDWKERGVDSPDLRGADWGAETSGSKIVRAGSLGLARSVQLRITASPATPRQRWGVDSIVAKFIMRRFR